MDFGMPFLLEAQNIEQCIGICDTLGLKFIELNLNFPQCQLQNLDCTKLSRVVKNGGIYFTIHLDENFNMCDFNFRVKDAYRRTMHDVIKIAKILRVPIINMHLPRGIHLTLPDRRTYLYQEFEEIYYKNIVEFRDMCDEAIGLSGIKIAIENTDGFLEHEKRAIEGLLIGKSFGLTLDIGHSHVAKDVDLPFFDKYEKHLIHMHAHDAKGSKNHLAFGDGELNLVEWLELAYKAKARVVLETKTLDALRKTVECMPRYF